VPTAAPAPGLRPPSQDRSQRTLDRILTATEELLEYHDFQDNSIHEIIYRAETSTGSFYARFEDKNALLTALCARYDATLPARTAAWQTHKDPAPTTLPGAALWTARSVAHSFRARRNLLRSLALQVRQHPELADESLRARRVAQHAFLIEALVRAGAQPAAAHTGRFFAVSICRERILFSDSPPARSGAESDAEDSAVMPNSHLTDHGRIIRLLYAIKALG
jgi:AcrR family transcriptional regulator